MLISKNWLEQFIDIPKELSSEELGTKIKFHIAEVEEVHSMEGALDKVVVGKIETIDKHPDADKLAVCAVAFGEDNPVQIVCGGSNLKVGQNIVLGLVGAKVRWHGEGDLIELKPVKIRGVKSYGMICAADEVGIGHLYPAKSESEIVDLGDIDVMPGTPLVDALGLVDVVFDIENKTITHRPDLWGHYGMARDVAALLDLPLKKYKVKKVVEGNEKKIDVSVEDFGLCNRYMALAIDGIEVGPSPDWLRERLVSVGMNSINNIVDVTNYVMLELGQPMHAFDADQLVMDNGQTIINVRTAKRGEKFVSLDEKEYELEKGMLVVTDAEHIVAVAGVKGSNNSGVTNKTKTIILEAANFDATSVRKTGAKLGLRTDASTRFEKSLDPFMVEDAMKKAVELVLQVCPGAKVVSKVVDEKNDLLGFGFGPIEGFSFEFLKEFIGIDISEKDVVGILQRLGFGESGRVDLDKPINIPSWRATKDIQTREDVAEEILRMHGFGEVLPTMPKFSISPPLQNMMRNFEHKVREVLACECGYTEVYNYSFVAPEWLEKLGEKTDKYIELDNPIAKDKPLLRRNIVPGLLSNLESNLHRCDSVSIFEIGRTFLEEEKGEFGDKENKTQLPKQDTCLGFAFVEKGNENPFFGASDVVRRLGSRLGFEVSFKKLSADHPMVHPGRYAELYVGKVLIGKIGEVHPVMQQNLGFDSRVAIVEINLNELLSEIGDSVHYSKLSLYPSVMRDIAFSVLTHVEHDEVVKIIRGVSDLIARVELFDVYQGEHIEEGKKSLAYHIEYRSEDKTLEASEVEKVHEMVVSELEKKVGARVRE